MSHSTVAHRWFHQIGNKRTNSNSFDSGNMFYINKIIYSYGRHFAIAIRFDNMVLFNSNGYSSSTSKHIGHTRSAIDYSTHNVMYVPFKSARNFRNDVDLKQVYKYIDYKEFYNDFLQALKKLGNARKPEIYLNQIQILQNDLNKIFKTLRGSKTYALKECSKLNKVLKFEFTDDLQIKLKEKRKKELKKQNVKKEAYKKEALLELKEYESLEKIRLGYNTLSTLGLNTVIRVNGDVIETSKGVKVNLKEGVRVFYLWENGKAIGTTINTMSSTWTCSKANGIIKFGCHEINYKQAKRVLKPYLK